MYLVKLVIIFYWYCIYGLNISIMLKIGGLFSLIQGILYKVVSYN